MGGLLTRTIVTPFNLDGRAVEAADTDPVVVRVAAPFVLDFVTYKLVFEEVTKVWEIESQMDIDSRLGSSLPITDVNDEFYGYITMFDTWEESERHANLAWGEREGRRILFVVS